MIIPLWNNLNIEKLNLKPTKLIDTQDSLSLTFKNIEITMIMYSGIYWCHIDQVPEIKKYLIDNNFYIFKIDIVRISDTQYAFKTYGKHPQCDPKTNMYCYPNFDISIINDKMINGFIDSIHVGRIDGSYYPELETFYDGIKNKHFRGVSV